MLINIDVNKLYRHPNNPRKDLGDLTELAESIKANGILQNLTVVPKEEHRNEGGKARLDVVYTVVIGHRRLAAAKLAGLTEIPCTITEMDEQKQLATMLLENIQRSDLTILEQAEGFQMMIQLGETITGISKITGFSETTVRHRVRLMELDRKKLAAAVERGGTLMDYIALEEIKDPKRKNKALEAIGTRDFQWALKQALEEEAMGPRKAALLEFLKDWAKPVKEQPKCTSHEKYFHQYKQDDFKKPKDANTAEYFYHEDSYGIALYKKTAAQDKKKKSPEEKAFDLRDNQLKDLTKRAYELRSAFVKDFNAGKKQTKEIMRLALSGMMTYNACDQEKLLKITGVEIPQFDEKISWSDKRKALDDLIVTQFESAPEHVLFMAAYTRFDDKPGNGYYQSRSWELKHRFETNNGLDRLYDALIALGYEMSDEERALREGTHELLMEAEA